MAERVTTTNLRFSFIEKTSTQVGDGTAYPMLVTADQLAEIFYRVKDAWFTSGSVSTVGYPEDLPPISGIGMSMEGGTPPTQLITGDGIDQFFIRGYCWWGHYFDLRAEDATYFNSPYGTDILPAYYPFFTEYLSFFFPPSVEPWVSAGEYLYRDIASMERGAWLPENPNVDPLVNETAKINGITARTAFSQEMSTAGATTGYMINHPAPSQLRLEIYPEVAWVDDNASGQPLDPLNRLYIKMRFGVLCTTTYESIALDTMPDSAYASFVEATDLIFQLADSTCQAKIYAYVGLDPIEFDSAYPFEITAQEWWPSAKDSPAVPVWDTATGIKL